MPRLTPKLRRLTREQQQEFLVKHWPLILHVTRAARRNHPNANDDILQMAALGVLRALDEHNPDRSKLSSYAGRRAKAWGLFEAHKEQAAGFGGLTHRLKSGEPVPAVCHLGSAPSKYGGHVNTLGDVTDPESLAAENPVEPDRLWRLAEECVSDFPHRTDRMRQKYLMVLREVFSKNKTCREVGREAGWTYQEVSRIKRRIVAILRRSTKFKKHVGELINKP